MIKLVIKLTIIITTIISLVACEDVVDIPLDNAEPKLVIDANIQWQKGTTGNEQIIKLTTTADYYTNVIPPANGATVTVTTDTDTFNFVEDANTGNYICTTFIPVINESYTLTVIYKGEIYTATDTLYETPVITDIVQTIETGFGGNDEIQIKFLFQDNGLQNNYYLVGFQNPTIVYPEIAALSDEFFQGNQMFGLYRDEDLKPNDVLELSLQGVSVRYYNFMNKLLNIAGSGGGSPFATAPATLKGNITNISNPNNFPFGYFALGEIDKRTYIVE